MYQLGDISFKTKEQIKTYVKQMLWSLPLSERLGDNTDRFLADFLKWHRNSALKIGAGIDYFTVESLVSNSRCFMVHRIDGTRTDFSYKSCLYPSKGKDATALKNAMRRAISGQIMAFRNSLHIHHASPYFDELAARFLAEHDLTAVESDIGGYVLIDDEITGLWQQYHMAHANLVPLTQQQHEQLHREE